MTLIFFDGGWCLHSGKPDCPRGVDVPTTFVDGIEFMPDLLCRLPGAAGGTGNLKQGERTC